MSDRDAAVPVETVPLLSSSAQQRSESASSSSSVLQHRTATASTSAEERTIATATTAPDRLPGTAAAQLLLPDILGQLRLVPNQPLIKLPLDDYPNPFQLPTIPPAMPMPYHHHQCIDTTTVPSDTLSSSSTVASNRQHHHHHLHANNTCNATADADTMHDKLFGRKCGKCRSSHGRRASAKSAEHSILHPPQFKQRIGPACSSGADTAATSGTTSTRKSSTANPENPHLPHHPHNRHRSTILRQPQLRLVQQCLQQGLTKSCANIADRNPTNADASPASSAASSALSTPQHHHQLHHHQASEPSTSSAASSSGATPPRSSALQKRLACCLRRPTTTSSRLAWKTSGLLDRSFADFRSLVTGCEGLSLAVGSVKQASHQATRLPPSFRQLQQSTTSHAFVPRPRRSLVGATLQASSLAGPSSAWKAPRSRSTEDLRSGRYRAHHQHHQYPHHGHQATCSQQATAGNEPTTTAAAAAATDSDVSIDELASYFETFVHIPKKMSTMAEMMYI